MMAPPVTHAMAVQLDRVNARRPADGAALEAELDRLQRIIREQQAHIERLEALLDMAGTPAPAGGHTLSGRPVVDIREAARMAGVSPATAWRYANTGWWEARQQGSHWLIYADQALKRKPRK